MKADQISGLGGDLSVIDDTEFKYDENEPNNETLLR